TSPLEGLHEYCVVYLANADTCCHKVVTLPSRPICSASSDQAGRVLIRWPDSVFETGYHLYRDSQLRAELPANDTSYVDVTVGSHEYCVEAFNDGGGSGCPACQGTAANFAPILSRLSWDTCSPQHANKDFTGPGSYTLVVSSLGTPEVVIGHDSKI